VRRSAASESISRCCGPNTEPDSVPRAKIVSNTWIITTSHYREGCSTEVALMCSANKQDVGTASLRMLLHHTGGGYTEQIIGTV
jgi:hypothetical protein